LSRWSRSLPPAAQGPPRDPAPEEQRLNDEMMTMMRDMRAHMQQMREHMAAMHGTGAMPGDMAQMQQCPALAPAPGGKSGG
jgi:hypothetical protein